MPKIVIQEKDETTIQEGNLLTDIVFIPGFADTNNNVFIFESFADTPTSLFGGAFSPEPITELSSFQNQYDVNNKKLPYTDSNGTYHPLGYPQFAVNTVNKKVWAFVNDAAVLGKFILGEDRIGSTSVNSDGEWKEINKFTVSDLLPENYPTLLETVADLKRKFGTEPYKFTKKQRAYADVPTLTEEEAEEYINSVVFNEYAVANTNEYDVMYEVGDADRSYIEAKEYLGNGLCVLYYNAVKRVSENSKTLGDKTYYKGQKLPATINDIYEELAMLTKNDKDDSITDDPEYPQTMSVLTMLEDRNLFSVKYLTSGGYPTFEITAGWEKPVKAENLDYETSSPSTNLVNLAKTRGDCVAIIDHTNNPLRKLSGSTSVYAQLTAEMGWPESGAQAALTEEGTGEFATMFTPWAKYSTGSGTFDMPGSYAYLKALSTSIRSYPNYLAVAGTARGQLTSLTDVDSIYQITNRIANELYQPRDRVAINPITMITPYGYTIWGNRTLFNNNQGNLVARSFLNIRNMVSDIKKQAYVVAKRLMFEQDSDVLWLRFKMGITPLLDSMKTGNGLSDYRVIRTTTKYDGSPLNKGEIAAVIRIFPKYAIEDWEITVVISDEEVTVE